MERQNEFILLTDSKTASGRLPIQSGNCPTAVRTDEQLLAAHLAGNAQAFGDLIARYERELFTYLSRFLSDRTAADDVFQETFIQISHSASGFDLTKRFRPWIYAIATNKARDFLRSRARRHTVPLQASIDAHDAGGRQFGDLMASAELGPVAVSQTHETAMRVHDALARLPEKFREIILLAYFQQLPYQQIAESLGLPLGTVKSRLHAAVEAFSEIWKSANRNEFVS